MDIPGKSRIRLSKLHRELHPAVAMDIATGRPGCQPYSAGRTRFEGFGFWSSDMLKLFREAGVPRRAPLRCRLAPWRIAQRRRASRPRCLASPMPCAVPGRRRHRAGGKHRGGCPERVLFDGGALHDAMLNRFGNLATLPHLARESAYPTKTQTACALDGVQ